MWVKKIITFLGRDSLESQDVLLICRPGMHFAVRFPSLLSQLVPMLGLGQKLGNSALRETKYVFGKQALSDVVRAEDFSNLLRDTSSVEHLGVIGLCPGDAL